MENCLYVSEMRCQTCIVPFTNQIISPAGLVSVYVFKMLSVVIFTLVMFNHVKN